MTQTYFAACFTRESWPLPFTRHKTVSHICFCSCGYLRIRLERDTLSSGVNLDNEISIERSMLRTSVPCGDIGLTRRQNRCLMPETFDFARPMSRNNFTHTALLYDECKTGTQLLDQNAFVSSLSLQVGCMKGRQSCLSIHLLRRT